MRRLMPLILCSLFLSHAHANPSPRSSASPVTPQQQTTDPATIVVPVNELHLSCIVQDRHSAPIPGLTSNDFRVSIDNQPARLLAVGTDSTVPLEVALLLDVSLSQKGMLALYADAVEGLRSALDATRDHVSIYTFGSDVRLYRDWQTAGSLDPQIIQHLDSKAGRLLEKHPFYTHGGTRLFDAVHHALGDIRGHTGRRSILVLTDGIDEGSSTSAGKLIDVADRGDISISALEFRPSGLALLSPSLPFKQLHDSLAVASRQTGGIFLHARAGEEPAQLHELISALKQQYLLYITPPTIAPGAHAVAIHVAPSRANTVLTHSKIWLVEAKR